MAYKVTWSAKAKSTYIGIMEYLEKEWTEREVVNFVNKVHEDLHLLSLQPRAGSIVRKRY